MEHPQNVVSVVKYVVPYYVLLASTVLKLVLNFPANCFWRQQLLLIQKQNKLLLRKKMAERETEVKKASNPVNADVEMIFKLQEKISLLKSQINEWKARGK